MSGSNNVDPDLAEEIGITPEELEALVDAENRDVAVGGESGERHRVRGL